MLPSHLISYLTLSPNVVWSVDPSCLYGLSRFDADSDTKADYIVVEIAERLLGHNWMQDYVTKANLGGIERVLV